MVASHQTASKLDVVKPDESFLGMSYGEWISVWSNWLVSEEVDFVLGQGMFFMRGNIDYTDVGGIRSKPPGGFYNRMDDRGINITTTTPIFIPVITAMISKGDYYDAGELYSDTGIRHAARRDIDQGRDMWAIYKSKGKDDQWTPIVDSLSKYRFESPKFILNVAEKSPLRERMEYPPIPGEHEAVTVGYFLIIKHLQEGNWRFRFGGTGRGDYHTDAVYDFTVEGKDTILANDISNQSDNSNKLAVLDAVNLKGIALKL